MSLNQLSADVCPATEGVHVQIYRQSSWLNHQFHGLCFFSAGFVSRLRRHCQLNHNRVTLRHHVGVHIINLSYLATVL